MLSFDYFYGEESEQFSYYRIPRLLVTGEQFKNLSTDAKMLYGMMLDRMGLSQKNGWYDKQGRVYIYYSMDEVMTDLCCGHDKALKLLAELDTKKGIGLIERVRQGQGKPSIIYVKRFATKQVHIEESRNPDFDNSEFLTSENQNSGLRNNRSLDFEKSEVSLYYNYPYNINLYKSYLYLSITQLGKSAELVDREKVKSCVMELIGYPAFTDQQRPQVDELVALMTDVLSSPQATYRIGGVQFKREVVQKRLVEIQQPHIAYVLDCLKKSTVKIRNIRGYLLTALYNAPVTIEHYYQSAVQHDLYRQQSEQ